MERAIDAGAEDVSLQDDASVCVEGPPTEFSSMRSKLEEAAVWLDFILVDGLVCSCTMLFILKFFCPYIHKKKYAILSLVYQLDTLMLE